MTIRNITVLKTGAQRNALIIGPNYGKRSLLLVMKLINNMLKDIIPKLPMRNKVQTQEFYLNQLDFELLADYGNYILVKKDEIEIHFFEFKDLNPLENYGQVYIRVVGIDQLYTSFIEKGISIHQNGKLDRKPWGQKEFSLLDPDHNLLTFGESI